MNALLACLVPTLAFVCTACATAAVLPTLAPGLLAAVAPAAVTHWLSAADAMMLCLTCATLAAVAFLVVLQFRSRAVLSKLERHIVAADGTANAQAVRIGAVERRCDRLEEYCAGR